MYTLGHVLMLYVLAATPHLVCTDMILPFSAHPYGNPTVLSSYTYSTTDDGAPNGNYGTCSGNSGSNGWYV